MIGQVAGWLAGKLFFGGNKGAVNVVPALVIAALLALASGWVSAKVSGWLSSRAITAAERRADELQVKLSAQAAEFEQARAAADKLHLEAMLQRDAMHQQELQRRAEVVKASQAKAQEASSRFARLNNRLKEIDRERPRAACPGHAADPARRLLLDEAQDAANDLPAAGDRGSAAGDRGG